MPNLVKCVALIATAAVAACATGPTEPTPAPAPTGLANTTVTAEFAGRVVDADTGGPVGNVKISFSAIAGEPRGWIFPKDTATPTSAADGTFTISLNLPSSWRRVWLKLTGPPGYDGGEQVFERATPAHRPTVRIYPTLVIGPGKSIDVRVDKDVFWCGSWDWAVPCRRLMVAASAGEAVELEIVSDDSSKPMALGMVLTDRPEDLWSLGDMSVRRLVVPSGGVAYVLGAGSARLTARR